MAISNSERRAQLERQRDAGRRPSAWASWLSVFGTLALLATCVASNVRLYLSEGDGLDVLVLGGTLLAILSGVIPRPPRNVAPIGLAIGGFLVVVLISLKNEWRGTPVDLILRSVATIVLSSCCFFAGASLRERATPKAMTYLQIGIGVLLAAVLVVTFGILHTAKNVMGGTMFALSMLTIAVLYVRTGKFTVATGLTGGALILVGAFLTDHRAMMVLGAGVGAMLAVFALYRPNWARVLPPMGGIAIAIGAVVVLTQMTQSSMFLQADQAVKEESGRTLKSGRETFWGIVVDAIAEGPLVGYGPTKKAQDITGLQFSTHNAFLQVGLQTGVIGLAMVFILFVVLIARAVNAPVSQAGAILAVYIAGVIIHNSSENVLFMNNFPIAAITWLNMGFLSASCFLDPLGAARVRTSSPQVRAREA